MGEFPSFARIAALVTCMKRKSILLAIALVLLLTSLAGGGYLMIRVEPAFYRAGAQPADDGRKDRSNEFVNASIGLYNDLAEAIELGAQDRSSWQYSFTTDLINSFFSEEFVKSGMGEKLLPKNLREPRVALEQDRIRLGCRYGTGAWSSVVTIDLRVWLVAREPNVVALELQGMRAGALPFSAQSLLEAIAEGVRQAHIDISPWYRRKGNPVALLKLQSERSATTARLTRLELRPGVLVIGGKTPHAQPPRDSVGQQTAGARPASGNLSPQP